MLFQHSTLIYGANSCTECRGDCTKQCGQFCLRHPYICRSGYRHSTVLVHRNNVPFHNQAVIWRNVRLFCSQRRKCRCLVSCSLPVGSVNNAFPLYSGRFSFICPRTVLTRLHVYGSPSVTSFYLSQLWIFALHSAHTTKVFLCI